MVDLFPLLHMTSAIKALDEVKGRQVNYGNNLNFEQMAIYLISFNLYDTFVFVYQFHSHIIREVNI